VANDKHDIEQWRGLAQLVREGVEHGASAIENAHLAIARRPFTVLEQVTPIAEPVRTIRRVHDGVVSTAYASVRLVTRTAGKATDLALDAIASSADRRSDSDSPQS
jgi:hypothetical protein